ERPTQEGEDPRGEERRFEARNLRQGEEGCEGGDRCGDPERDEDGSPRKEEPEPRPDRHSQDAPPAATRTDPWPHSMHRPGGTWCMLADVMDRVGVDKRAHPRIPIELRVDYPKLNAFFADYTRNISKGGTFVRTAQP